MESDSTEDPCLICFKRGNRAPTATGSKPGDSVEDDGGTGGLSRTIFVLKNLLGVPGHKIEEFSAALTDHQLNSRITLCGDCDKQVEEARIYFRGAQEQCRLYLSLKDIVMKKVRSTVAPRTPPTSNLDSLDKLRSFVAQSDGSSDDIIGALRRDQKLTERLIKKVCCKEDISLATEYDDDYEESSELFRDQKDMKVEYPLVNGIGRIDDEGEDKRPILSSFHNRQNANGPLETMHVCKVDKCGRVFGREEMLEKHVILEHGLNLTKSSSEDENMSNEKRRTGRPVKTAAPKILPLLPPRRKRGRPGRPPNASKRQFVSSSTLMLMKSGPLVEGQFKRRGPGRPKRQIPLLTPVPSFDDFGRERRRGPGRPPSKMPILEMTASPLETTSRDSAHVETMDTGSQGSATITTAATVMEHHQKFESTPVEKRGRGRPRKNPNVQPLPTLTLINGEKRRPGRPRKKPRVVIHQNGVGHDLISESREVAKDASANQIPVIRKRGRPKRVRPLMEERKISTGSLETTPSHPTTKPALLPIPGVNSRFLKIKITGDNAQKEAPPSANTSSTPEETNGGTPSTLVETVVRKRPGRPPKQKQPPVATVTIEQGSPSSPAPIPSSNGDDTNMKAAPEEAVAVPTTEIPV